jgi:hypothetical protein
MPLNTVRARLDDDADNMRFTQVEGSGSAAQTALDSFLMTPEFSGAASKMGAQDEACAMCQYFVQRIHGAIIQYTQENGQRKSEAETKTEGKGSGEAPAPAEFLEIESQVTGSGVSTKVGFILNGRTRNSEFIGAGPPDVRYSPLVLPAEEAMAEREQYKTMQLVVYKMLQDMCATRMPLSFLGYCKSAMDNFRHITQGLHYGDRPDSICLSIQSCTADSYAAIQPHSMTRIDTAAITG